MRLAGEGTAVDSGNLQYAPSRSIDDRLHETSALAVVIDTFEQRVQRCNDRDVADYSGKKEQYTLKRQVAVDQETGQIVEVADSLPGPTADRTVLEQSQLLERLPFGVGGIGDLAYVGIGKLHPQGLGASPRRKPRGKDRPPDDVIYNRAFSRGGSWWDIVVDGCGAIKQ